MSETALAISEAQTAVQPLEHVAAAITLTPAQARVESVARTMDAAMNRASTLTLTPEEVTALKADFPDEAFKPGAAGKENLIYIEHAFLRDRFDQVIGMGQWALLRTRPHWAEEFETQKREKAVRIYADCVLLIRGCMVSEAIGEMVYYPNNAAQNYGDAAEGAQTAAFRRCAKNFGVGLQAWKKDFCEGWWARRKTVLPPKRQYTPGGPASHEPPGGWQGAAGASSGDNADFEAAKPAKPAAKPVQQEMPVTAKVFKSASERKTSLEAHLIKCKRKLVSGMEIQSVGVTQEYLEKAGHIMPNETTADANELTLFRSVPMHPDDRETDGDWWARVHEAVARDANQIQRDFDSFARGDQLEGAEVADQDAESQAPPLPAGAKQLSGFVKMVNKKPTSKGGTKGGILIVQYMEDREGGEWANTFDLEDIATAERLKGQEVQISYTEDKWGKNLCKHAIVEIN